MNYCFSLFSSNNFYTELTYLSKSLLSTFPPEIVTSTFLFDTSILFDKTAAKPTHPLGSLIILNSSYKYFIAAHTSLSDTVNPSSQFNRLIGNVICPGISTSRASQIVD